ncbi:MAG: response regulator transcription factor [Chitinophagaceae bacterium]|nr:response regulator transcription factor [Chitinophagaceae bacterium]
MLVLIVDRSIEIIERLEEIISEAESITAIHKAFSLEQARGIFKENVYDAVLLDMDLPGDESVKLLEEIKNIRKETRVIILYNHIDDYIRERCKYLNVDFFFDKYYDFEKICGLLCNQSFMGEAGLRYRPEG